MSTYIYFLESKNTEGTSDQSHSHNDASCDSSEIESANLIENSNCQFQSEVVMKLCSKSKNKSKARKLKRHFMNKIYF